MAAAEPRPRIVTSLNPSPGRYRRRGEPQDVGVLRDGALVGVDVGRGLRTEDLPKTVAFARSIRNAQKLTIHGRTPRAVAEARKVFLAAWELPDDHAPAAETAAGAWAALMLAHTRPTGGGGTS